MEDGEPSDRWSSARVAGGEASDRTFGCQGMAASGIESSEIKWTNEKHSMYLNYIEETFVNQLYNCEYRLTDSVSRPLRIENNLFSPGSNPKDFYSSRFTNHRRGAQERSVSERSRTHKSNRNDPYLSSSSACCSGGHETSSSSLQFPSTMDAFLPKPVGSSIEMSDQNFVDNNYNGDKKARKTSRNRRTRNVANTTLQNDQVVPHGKLL